MEKAGNKFHLICRYLYRYLYRYLDRYLGEKRALGNPAMSLPVLPFDWAAGFLARIDVGFAMRISGGFRANTHMKFLHLRPTVLHSPCHTIATPRIII
jgi:hypothetical protein